MMGDILRESTKIVRSTITPAIAGTAIHDGPVFAAAYHTPGDPSQTPYTYARSHNPTWTELERIIGRMESGEFASGKGYRASALVFASGMAAVAAVFGAVLRPGDVVVIPAGSYYTARVLLNEYFVKMGVKVRTAATMGPDATNMPALLEGARLLWIETPSNPSMEICDIEALCDAAHQAGALVAVDNTTPTPLGQKPLALGADFSVASDTKAMTGHGDILLGHVAMRDLELRGQIDQWRTLTGGILGPMEAWLAVRSIPTLPLRLERACENAQRMAEYLTTRSEVEAVLYPGLPTHPGHEIAKRQMRHFGPVLSFVLKDRAAADAFLSAAKLVTEATSFGSVMTTAERRARWGGDAVAEGFVRMSVGCEAIEDLIEDVGLALDSLAQSREAIA